MNDIKATLVEKERLAWIDGKIRQAELYADILNHIIALEEEINTRDREASETRAELERIRGELRGANS
jgi:hypothetical protein